MGPRSAAGPQWWDRDVDDQGTPLRADVRLAAKQLWPAACRHARHMLVDESEATELLEASLVQLSHDLDRRQIKQSVEAASSLLSRDFSMQLYQRAIKLGRIQDNASNEGSSQPSD